MPPKTRYAKSGGVHIAYQVLGDGPFDLVFVPGFVSNVEHYWEMPVVPRMLNRLASFSRLILFDKRGTGLSDPVSEVPSLDQRVQDLMAVMAAAGSERAALWGISEGGPTSIHFAARHPDRTTALVLYGTTARFSDAPDYPLGFSREALDNLVDTLEGHWGEGALANLFAPNFASDEAFLATWGRYQRTGASPSMARALIRALWEIDVRGDLPRIQVPTLILHRVGELMLSVSHARYMAERIPGAKLVELPGEDHLPFVGDVDAIVDEMEEFLTGTRVGVEPDRVLATVLFTDIVGSTEKAHALGDRAWRDLLDRHHAVVRRELERFRGREVDTAGDGFLTRFDSPAAAIRCARTIREGVRGIGLEVRVGVHTGECEVMGEKIGGIAVHIGARVAAEAAPGEVLVSSTVKDLVAGSDLRFTDRGTHTLKGVPGEWRLFAVEG